MEIIIKNGIVKIETRKKFNPGIEKFSLDDAKNIMALFNKENGSRIDIEVIDIDLFDETKAFEYDFSNNPIIHCGSFCDFYILYFSIREFVRRDNKNNTTFIYFDIEDSSLDGSINIFGNSYKFYNLSPDDLFINKLPDNIIVSYEF